MRGDVDEAVADFRRQARPDDSVAIDLPLRASRAADDMLLVDRWQVRLLDDTGRRGLPAVVQEAIRTASVTAAFLLKKK